VRSFTGLLVRWLCRGVICVLLGSYGWTQTPAASQTTTPGGGATAAASIEQPTVVPGKRPHDDSFIIGNDDVLTIDVWKEPDMSRTVPVRSDGRISLPLLGEVQAAGLTPLKLEEDLAAKLQPFIAEPEVTVIVQQINSQRFNILGKVVKPGTYTLTNSATVLDAIALAGGCRDFAKQSSIYILRRNADGSESRIAFNYKEVIKGKNMAQDIKLQPHDTIVVP